MKRKAFSLIELSIVILIIGILVAGVTQSSRLVAAMKLNTAKAVTQSSPVAGVKGLVLWIESTSDDSFLSSETEDGSQLSRWNDINPQTVSKLFFLKTATASAKYVASGINALPSVYLDGTIAGGVNFMLSTTSGSTTNTPLPTTSNAFTFFAVIKTDFTKNSAYGYLFSNGNSPSNGFGFNVGTGAKTNGVTYFGAGVDPSTGSNGSSVNAQVLSYTSIGGTSGAFQLYANGSTTGQAMSPSSATMLTPTVSFRLGAREANNMAWSGWISELIFYDRVLKTEERQAIEKYLGKKYGLTVS